MSDRGRPLSIGVNALYLIPGAVGGTEIYLRNLLFALSEIDRVNRYVVFLNRETDPSLVPDRANFSCIRHPVPARVRPFRIAWEQLVLPLCTLVRGIDVLFNPGFTTPVLTTSRVVTVFHDLQHKRHPEFFRWFDLPFWRLFLWGSAHRSSRLIAVSQATREDLLHYYALPPGRVRVVHHGVGDRFFEIGWERRRLTPEPFVLCVSTLHPHKNLDRLVDAFAEVRRAIPCCKLTLVGLRGHHTKPLESRVHDLGLDDAVEFTGWIPRERLFDLFLRASAFVYPSLFEGFGMPVAEAMAAGIPTACSWIDPLREVAGDAALLFDPDDTRAIRDALLRLLGDGELRTRLAAAGPERASEFSWDEAAKQTLETILDAYRNKSSS